MIGRAVKDNLLKGGWLKAQCKKKRLETRKKAGEKTFDPNREIT